MPSGSAQTSQRSRASFSTRRRKHRKSRRVTNCRTVRSDSAARPRRRAASARTCDKATRIVCGAERRIIATLLTPRLNEACGRASTSPSPVCPTCPQLRLQPAVRPMTQAPAADLRSPCRHVRCGRVPAARDRAAHERAPRIHQGGPAAVLDAGCGPGDDLPALRARFPEAPVFGVDLSGAMLARAGSARSSRRAGAAGCRLARPRTGRAARASRADFAALPFPGGAFDLIWSNLALHWHSRPDAVLPEWQRVLRVNGLLMFSTLGIRCANCARPARRRSGAGHGAARRARDRFRRHARPRRHARRERLRDSRDGMGSADRHLQIPDSLLADVRRWGAIRSTARRAQRDAALSRGARRRAGGPPARGRHIR